jgi:MarR family transcriptional regulator, organic hydroperoxide resistance regulator
MYMSTKDSAEDFVGCLTGNLRAAARLATRRYDAALREHGLRITQIAIMAQVQRHGPVSMTHLGLALASERSVIARDVAILERDGLLNVAVDPDDQRARAITLTKDGNKRLRAAAPAWRRAQHDMRRALGPALAAQLLDVTRNVVTALEEG